MTKTALCAQCRKHPVEAAYRPFCSKRCADVDLGQWLKGGYVISGGATDTEEDESGLGGGPGQPELTEDDPEAPRGKPH
jgi:hypothetical protein